MFRAELNQFGTLRSNAPQPTYWQSPGTESGPDQTIVVISDNSTFSQRRDTRNSYLRLARAFPADLRMVTDRVLVITGALERQGRELDLRYGPRVSDGMWDASAVH
jgi:hypothetical protein